MPLPSRRSCGVQATPRSLLFRGRASACLAAAVFLACSSTGGSGTDDETAGQGSGAAGNGSVGTAGKNSSGGSSATLGTSGSPSSGGGGASATGGTAQTSGGFAGSMPSGGLGGSSTGAAGSSGGGSSGANAGGGTANAGSGGASGGAGGGGTMGPCDIYAAANTPCVAAHSTVRALFGSYSGPLYQVRRASDKTTKDIPVLARGGFADTATQDSFCSGTTCTISVLYDQSTYKNDLVKSPVAHWLPNGGSEADASKGKITVSGHSVHGIYVTGFSGNVAYRNNATKGVAKGDQAEAMYMVVDGKRFSDQCCFDYGNAETSGNDDGNGTMEAVYWGTDITWGGHGDGNGPWIAADLENGMFKSNQGGWQSQAITTSSAKSIIANFATAMLKGPSGNHFTLKGGDAQAGTLTTMWDGVRPSPGYSPKKLPGAIILGTGGDGSNGGTGTFFEGAMTIGTPADSVDAAIQANIVAAGYGH